VHSVLLRAYRHDGAPADARREAEWLAQHRGRAYVEWGDQFLLQPANVLETDLALLEAAEIARETGDRALAARQLDKFRAAWKQPPALVARRVASLQDWLTQRSP
jgi:hypothetical protein